jgi:hypothetical protein
MAHGRSSRGPVGRISGLTRVESAEVISRVRGAERISGAAAIESRPQSERSFAAALERNERGLGRSEPLPSPEPRRPLQPLPRQRECESLEPPQPLPDTFLGLLWWKVKGQI